MVEVVLDFCMTVAVVAATMLVIDLAFAPYKRRPSIAGDLAYAAFDGVRALVRRRNRIPRARLVRRR